MNTKHFWGLVVLATAGAVVVLISAGGAQAATSLFGDGFESGDFANWTSAEAPWTVNGTTAHGGVKRATATGPGSGALVKQESTTGFENITLSYWYRIQQSLESADHVAVELSADGTSWTPVAIYTGPATGSFQFASWPLPASANDQTHFEFRFHASLGNSSDTFWLDDVELTGNPIPTPTPTPTPEPSASPTPVQTPASFPETDIDDPTWLSNFHDYVRNFFLRLVHKASKIR